LTENIKTSINWSKIYIKNLRTGKKVAITKTISGNTLKIKMNLRRSSYNTYQVYIPASAIKDLAGNNLVKFYSFKFKTGKY
ncbi:MAG: Ig-like domain-containing protein, partial [Methanobacteriaceae archaeon]|nr:Ig-like domain-containing protein [Methanobacteriaceae archaeon]